ENGSSLKTLSLRSYRLLSRDILGYFRLGAISTAARILRNHRSVRRKNPRTRFPYARKLMLTTCYGFKIQNNLLRLPVKPRHYVHVKLNSHTLKAHSGIDARSDASTFTVERLYFSGNLAS